MREIRILSALDRGPSGRDDLLAEVYEGTPTALWPLARLALEAHLKKLIAEARVVEGAGTLRLRGPGERAQAQ